MSIYCSEKTSINRSLLKNSSKAAIVVAPGYLPELISDLLRARVLSSSADLVVLLPPEKTREYDQLIEEKHSSGVRLLPSPGRRFFSTPHLKWLKINLRSSENNMVLISNSLDRDLTSAMVAFIVLLLSGKSITQFRKTNATAHESHESVIAVTDQSLGQQWTSKEFNLKMLAREILMRITIAPKGHPWQLHEILYLLMFVGLIVKQSVIRKLSSLFHILQEKLLLIDRSMMR